MLEKEKDQGNIFYLIPASMLVALAYCPRLLLSPTRLASAACSLSRGSSRNIAEPAAGKVPPPSMISLSWPNPQYMPLHFLANMNSNKCKLYYLFP
jgi:hypothetical protein